MACGKRQGGHVFVTAASGSVASTEFVGRVTPVGRVEARRARSRSGSTLVETTLIILPLLAVLFGTFDVAFAIFVKNTVQYAVCQGVRYAITSQTLPGKGQDDSIKSVVTNSSIGLLDVLSPTHVGTDTISITYYNPQTLTPVTGSNSNIGGNIVVVSASGLSWAWMFPLLRDATPLRYAVSSADVMEATPLGGPPAR